MSHQVRDLDKGLRAFAIAGTKSPTKYPAHFKTAFIGLFHPFCANHLKTAPDFGSDYDGH